MLRGKSIVSYYSIRLAMRKNPKFENGMPFAAQSMELIKLLPDYVERVKVD